MRVDWYHWHVLAMIFRVRIFEKRNWLRGLVMHRIFGKMLSASVLLDLGGPAGGSAPGKVLRLQECIPHDS